MTGIRSLFTLVRNCFGLVTGSCDRTQGNNSFVRNPSGRQVNMTSHVFLVEACQQAYFGRCRCVLFTYCLSSESLLFPICCLRRRVYLKTSGQPNILKER